MATINCKSLPHSTIHIYINMDWITWVTKACLFMPLHLFLLPSLLMGFPALSYFPKSYHHSVFFLRLLSSALWHHLSFITLLSFHFHILPASNDLLTLLTNWWMLLMGDWLTGCTLTDLLLTLIAKPFLSHIILVSIRLFNEVQVEIYIIRMQRMNL